MYTAYRHQHPEDFVTRSTPHRRPAPTVSKVASVAVYDYFAAHTDQLIRLADVVKSLGIKRSEVQRVLADAPWARMVDSTTYFFVPQN